MLYKIKYDIDNSDEEEVLIDAESEKEAVLQWFSDNYDDIIGDTSEGDEVEAETFTLEIHTMKIEKAKLRNIKIER